MKNAIVYLLNNHPKDINNFRSSISYLITNYLNYFPCELIFFHENNFPKTEINLITDALSALNFKFKFLEINFVLPAYKEEILKEIPEFFPHPDFPECQGFSMGYRHMCRFFAGEIFKHKELQEYDFVWRLDTDSFILNNFGYDVFEKMSLNQAVYGYVNIQNDHEGVIKNLWPFCEKYFLNVNKDGIFKNNKDFHFRKVFYTNFEVFNMSWFKDADYQSFYNYIDESAGIYKYRWGDHVIRYIALNSLVDKSQLLFFNDIDYFHSERYFNREFYDSFV